MLKFDGEVSILLSDTQQKSLNTSNTRRSRILVTFSGVDAGIGVKTLIFT